MKLYYNPLSTFSQKAQIAFHEKGIDYTVERVDLASPESRAAYEQVYPIGKVPFLVADDERHVPESTTIIEYLEDRHPGTCELIPHADREAARQVRFMDRMMDNYLDEPVVELLLQMIGARPRDEARAQTARKHLAASYAHLEQRLSHQGWLCGERFSMADCAAIPPLFYAQIVAPFAQHPNLVAYWERAQQRESYAKVKAAFEPVWNAMMAQREAA